MAPLGAYLVEAGPARPESGSTPSASAIFRNAVAKNGYPALEVATLYELFSRSSTKYANEPCLGVRPKLASGEAGLFQFKTYKEVADDVANIASGLAAFGLEKGARVGVFGPNTPEWMTAMQACNRMSYLCVPLYDSLGENAIEYIIRHAEVGVVFVAADKLPALIKALPLVKGVLQNIVVWGAAAPAQMQAAAEAGFGVRGFAELAAAGSAAPVFPVPPSPEDYCTIMYTSGTTGDPKGVLLKHSALVAIISSLISFLAVVGLKFAPGDSTLSYLPLAHIFDRALEELFLYSGAAIGYWQGDIVKLVDDIGVLRPTLFIGVPRVFDRIYSRVMGQLREGSFVKRSLFNYAFQRKLHFLNKGYPQEKAAPFFDKLVFSKVKQRLGGRCKLVVSGGAPLSAHVEEFLRVAMCCPVVQGYGLTENCAGASIAVPGVIAHAGTVGVCMPCAEMRFESVPEMHYDALDAARPGGEVLLRGPQLFSGYYKQQKQTDEVLEADGWFHTGDIGILTPEGALKIVDRKKNIFKLSQGEYIAVEKVEGCLKACKLVEQLWVYGNSFKSCLVAVLLPAKELLIKEAAALGVSGSFEALCANPAVKKHVVTELLAAGKAAKLKGFEQVKAVHLDTEGFSVENNLMTPSFKLKRPQLQAKFQAQLDAMYVALGE